MSKELMLHIPPVRAQDSSATMSAVKHLYYPETRPFLKKQYRLQSFDDKRHKKVKYYITPQRQTEPL